MPFSQVCVACTRDEALAFGARMLGVTVKSVLRRSNTPQ